MKMWLTTAVLFAVSAVSIGATASRSGKASELTGNSVLNPFTMKVVAVDRIPRSLGTLTPTPPVVVLEGGVRPGPFTPPPRSPYAPPPR